MTSGLTRLALGYGTEICENSNFRVPNFDFTVIFEICIPSLFVDFFGFVENLRMGIPNFKIIFYFLKST